MEYVVNFTWDNEADVWIATSDDIPGLVLESGMLPYSEIMILSASGFREMSSVSPYSLMYASLLIMKIPTYPPGGQHSVHRVPPKCISRDGGIHPWQ